MEASTWLLLISIPAMLVCIFAPRGNKSALKHGRYTREAIAERAHIRELVRQARKLLLQIE